MGELGPDAAGYHREVGEHARAAGVDLLIGVGEPARDYDPDELVADPGEAAELLAAQLRSRATRSWSRARARPASRPSPRRCRS